MFLVYQYCRSLRTSIVLLDRVFHKGVVVNFAKLNTYLSFIDMVGIKRRLRVY